MYIYIYIYRERERKRGKYNHCVYINIEREGNNIYIDKLCRSFHILNHHRLGMDLLSSRCPPESCPLDDGKSWKISLEADLPIDSRFQRARSQRKTWTRPIGLPLLAQGLRSHLHSCAAMLNCSTRLAPLSFLSPLGSQLPTSGDLSGNLTPPRSKVVMSCAKDKCDSKIPGTSDYMQYVMYTCVCVYIYL